ncbi:DUF2184 domain-containing protein [Burkholderia multivorans]|uniref:Bacteriophage protein n=3 Tax=Burkholderia multivorans TaxID=87883 RepID=A0A0H3KEN6_BURM1|nr:DUF2184 domain-containing protein [Burkholderia multivorans]ABX15511.1 putative bacteriophage protein [Burkholderia multivorans ATCC 17616]MCA8177457.1 DUF2184 domain-containing protein [Burkholderia multivorans]PRF51332.1 DUF2184 domain-containing protein [Burkholderia multivorans]BAG43353.1 putative bacteriophage protein [Burkholderia multivorans ATCC 17616]
MTTHNKSLLARAAGIAIAGAPAIIRARTRDSMMTFDARTIDSTGAFLVGELERLDQTLHMPLASVTWSRDIDLREDVSIADEVSSFTNSMFAAAGGPSPAGKSWVGKDANAIQSLGLDIGKTPNPLTLWGMQIGWTIPELESAQKLGRPVDQQKFEGMQLKHNMDVDEQVYIGDSVLGVTGLVNSSAVENVSNAQTGNWVSATPDQMLDDVNELLNSAWAAAGYAVCPSRVLLDPTSFSLLVQRKVSDAGNISVLRYLQDNSLANQLNGRPLEIFPSKWLTGRGAAGKNRMVAYTKDKNRVRFPLVPLQRTPLEYRDLRQLVTYFGRLGVVEVVYPETIAYRDGV